MGSVAASAKGLVLIHRLIKVGDRLSATTGLVGASLVIPLAVVMGYEVIARFFFDWPTFWAYEIAWMLTGAHFALGIGWVTLQRRHVRVDFFYARMSRRRQALVDLVVNAGFVLPCMAWVSSLLLRFAWEAWVKGEVSGESAWNPLVWPINTAIAFGFMVFSVQLLAEIGCDALIVLGKSAPSAETGSA